MENNIKNFYDEDELKNYLFNLWETNKFITINEIKFNTVEYILAYDIASEQFEIYSENDSSYDYLICSFLSLSIKTINNQIITVE
jgi:hypothetical protein